MRSATVGRLEEGIHRGRLNRWQTLQRRWWSLAGRNRGEKKDNRADCGPHERESAEAALLFDEGVILQHNRAAPPGADDIG